MVHSISPVLQNPGATAAWSGEHVLDDVDLDGDRVLLVTVYDNGPPGPTTPEVIGASHPLLVNLVRAGKCWQANGSMLASCIHLAWKISMCDKCTYPYCRRSNSYNSPSDMIVANRALVFMLQR